MKIFLSWSGARSKLVARALREWIPLVLHYAQPWMSDADIAAGERWGMEIGRELETSVFGIICLTPENVTAPWIHFEAGALAKSMEQGAVCPFLLELDFGDILSGPLAQFQAKKSDRQSTLDLVRAINERSPSPVSEERLRELFDALWSRLETKLGDIPAPSAPQRVVRPQQDVLEDLVGTVKRLEQRIGKTETVLIERLDELEDLRPMAPIKVDIPAGVLGQGSEAREADVSIASGRSLVRAVARALGLDPAGFDSEWYIEDPRKNTVLDRNQLRDIDRYFGGGPRHLRITSLPF